MAKKSGTPKQGGSAQDKFEDKSESDSLLESLKRHGQVVESEDPDVPLGPGQTHVLVKKAGQPGGKLIERRKSLFKR
jgi:hypothetical protein